MNYVSNDPYVIYQQLRARGMSAQEALRAAFPNGAPNQDSKIFQYQSLRSQGVPAQQALQQVYPNGVPKEEEAKVSQSDQMLAMAGQVGGLYAGNYATGAIKDAVVNYFASPATTGAVTGATTGTTGAITGATTGAATGAATGTTTGAATGATTGAGAGLGSAALTAGTGLAGLYGGYQTYKYMNEAPAGGRRNNQSGIMGAGSGAAIGSIIPGLGTLGGALIGLAAGYLGSKFGSKKGGKQLNRDNARDFLQEFKVLDKVDGRHRLDLDGVAGGDYYDIGADINDKAERIDPVTGKKIMSWNLTEDEKLRYGDQVGYADALAAALMSGATDKDTRGAFAGHFARAGIQSNSDDFFKNMFSRAGLNSREQILDHYGQLERDGKIDQGLAAVYGNAVNKLYGENKELINPNAYDPNYNPQMFSSGDLNQSQRDHLSLLGRAQGDLGIKNHIATMPSNNYSAPFTNLQNSNALDNFSIDPEELKRRLQSRNGLTQY